MIPQVALIGCGNIAYSHLKSVELSGGVVKCATSSTPESRTWQELHSFHPQVKWESLEFILNDSEVV